MNVIEYAPGHPEHRFDYGAKFALKEKVDHSNLMSSQQFQGLLARRSILLTDILIEIAFEFEDDLNATITVLEHELAR